MRSLSGGGTRENDGDDRPRIGTRRTMGNAMNKESRLTGNLTG